MTSPIPSGALEHHVAFLGKTGSGKSNAARTIVEDSLDAGERVCVLDPTGACLDHAARVVRRRSGRLTANERFKERRKAVREARA